MLHLVTFGLSDQLLIITNHPRHILCCTDAGLTNVTAFLDQDLNWNIIHSQVLYASIEVTSSYPGWIKSPHVVTLGILKILDLDSLTIFIGGGYSGVNFGDPKSEVFQKGGYSGVNFGHMLRLK